MKLRAVSILVIAVLAFDLGIGKAQSPTNSSSAVSGSSIEPAANPASVQGIQVPVSTTSAPAAVEQSSGPMRTGVPLVDIAQACARASGSQVVVDDPSLDQKLLEGVRPEGGVNYCATFAYALSLQGLTIAKEANMYHVVEGSQPADVPQYQP
jgi:hypothetical protein